ncbi:MAG: GTP-binding protein, partial [Thermodesulfobacteriota bacterium]|nr:GTP-binding protein [Thermodesulfobacteriota bacterium]
VERSLRVLDGAVVIMCGVGGVEAQTEGVVLQAKRYNVPLIAFINKLDRPGAGFSLVVRQMKERLDLNPLVLFLPCYEGDSLKGVIDLVEFRQIEWTDEDGIEYTTGAIDPERMEEARAAREVMMEALSDMDDAFMERYLLGEDVDVPLIKKVIRRATINNDLVPVFMGSALHNRGIQPLVDGVIDYLPSPLDVHSPVACDLETRQKCKVHAEPHGDLLAYVFKVYMDDGHRLVYLRIYSGTLYAGQEVYNPGRDKDERVARIFAMHAHHRQKLKSATAGDIVAVVGLKASVTGDTLGIKGSSLVLETMDISKPVISVAIEPKNSEAASRLERMIPRIMVEDPTLRVHEDMDTGQVILEGMGELHLEIAAERFRDAFGVEMNIGRPQVMYCSSIDKQASSEVVFDKVIGDTPHYGHLRVLVEPAKRGAGNIFNIETGVDEEVKRYILDGLEEGVLSDPAHGYEMVDIQARVADVFVESRTTGQGMKIATVMAFKDAVEKAGILRLEPVMEMEVHCPGDGLGDVVGDLNARKASVESVEIKGKYHHIRAHIPLSRAFGYSTQIRSLTKGRGSFSMKFFGFDRG